MWRRHIDAYLRLAYLDMAEVHVTTMFLQPSSNVHVRISHVIEHETAVTIRYRLRCRLGYICICYSW